MFLHCSRCDAPVNIATSTGAPYWCPFCGVNFKPGPPRAAVQRPLPSPQAPPKPAPAAVAVTEATAESPARHLEAPPMLAAATVPLPPGMPPEVATLGDPEEVFAPDQAQVHLNQCLIYGGAACTAVLLLGLGVFLLYAAVRPFGVNAPPAAVLLGLGSGAVVLAFVAIAAAFWTNNSTFAQDRWGPRTLLFYPNVLAEVRPGGHRLLSWEALGEVKTLDTLGSYYRVTVQGGRPLTFDHTVRDHAQCRAELQRRAAECRFGQALRNEADLQALKAQRVGPSILTATVGLTGEVFRITGLGDHLVFYKVQAAAGISPKPPPNMGGMVGAVAVWSYSKARHKFLAEMNELGRADAATLLARAAESDGSFVIAAREVTEVELNPRSLTRDLLFGVRGLPQEGILKLVHERRGTMSLSVLSREDMATVLEHWPRLFGNALRVNVVWCNESYRFVART